jgi:signal peptidase
MAIKTLDELNREFRDNRQVEQKPAQKPATKRMAPKITPASSLRGEDSGKQIELNHMQVANKKWGALSLTANILLGMTMILLLLVVITSKTAEGTPTSFMGIASYAVVSGSMGDEIPTGSLILVKNTDPRELAVGDDITFTRSDETSVTHQITDVYENYMGSGYRAFQTQGIMNPVPDQEIVDNDHLIGKVFFVLPVAGAVLSFLGDHVLLVIIASLLLLSLPLIVRKLLAK